MKFILFILTSLILIMLVSGGYIFFFACVRKKELRWLVEEEVKQTPYKVYYDHILSADRWLTDHDALDVYIKSDDGLRLHGLWIQADKPRGTILLAHGYRSSYLVDFSMAFDFYHQQGLNILVPDQRSHGKSEGRFITFGVKESRDMLCWIAWHNKRFGKQPMLLSGMSMGASTVLYLADKPLPSNICGLIAD